MKSQYQNKRLLALDIMRGITIAGMILVNNPGSWGHIYAPLEHAEWNGLTPTDLVFPFFMFIMGVSTYISLRRYNYSFSWPAVFKIVRRSVVIFAIGLAIAWLSLFLRGMFSGQTLWDSVMTFDHIRVLGVMPRLAICYGVGALTGIALDHKFLPVFIVTLLAVYAVMLLAGRGWEFSLENIISRVDHAVLGPDHMYTDTVGGVSLKFDPRGTALDHPVDSPHADRFLVRPADTDHYRQPRARAQAVYCRHVADIYRFSPQLRDAD